jgi:hypothetical protein
MDEFLVSQECEENRKAPRQAGLFCTEAKLRFASDALNVAMLCKSIL